MAVMTAIAIAALVTSAYSTYAAQRGASQASRAQKEAGEEAKRIADDNAAQAEIDALDASRRGVEEEGMMRRDVRPQIGRSVAGYGVQGVDVSMGTPVDVRTSAERLLQSDLDRIRRNAEREAMGFKAEAKNYRLGGQYARRAAQNQARATVLGGRAAIAAQVPGYLQGAGALYAARPRTVNGQSTGWL